MNHTSSADFAGSEMPYLLNAITRNVYVVDGTRFWYEMRYSWMAPPSVFVSVFHLSSSTADNENDNLIGRYYFSFKKSVRLRRGKSNSKKRLARLKVNAICTLKIITRTCTTYD